MLKFQIEKYLFYDAERHELILSQKSNLNFIYNDSNLNLFYFYMIVKL